MTLGIVAGYIYNATTDGGFGVRTWNVGTSSWDDITYNLADPLLYTGVAGDPTTYIAPGDPGFQPKLWDLAFVGGKLYAVVHNNDDQWGWVMRLDGTTWTTAASPFAPMIVDRFGTWASCYDGIFCWNHKAYVHGMVSSEAHWALWSLKSGRVQQVAVDTNLDMPLYRSRRTAVKPYPHSKKLLASDLYVDAWGRYDRQTAQFSDSGDQAGSCVFALGFDHDGIVWSGDYSGWFYYSVDQGASYVKVIGTLTYERELATGDIVDITAGGGLGVVVVPNSDVLIPEVWEFYQWGDRFIGVGCFPCNIVQRTTAVYSDRDAAWTPILKLRDHFPGQELSSDGWGMGFICCEALDADTLFLGFGGEPYYYNKDAATFGVVATVYAYKTDGTLTDIGGGLDWGSGCHILTSPARRCGLSPIPGAHDLQGARFDPTEEPTGRRQAIRT